ncbi:rossmann fold nucleotide-binding protein [Candidatus Scalindua japonica]|uniref:Rossmann fold nucleotide-binding protein n=1 Tax=Candidatus Scalindua japonica TaxID=1284222 RepID=A0A286U424_9BACT|nr:TIGR00725 family protein [Candidatus Scalindua japonica]GAX62873.1 rossmann fold nucleotide-binding protein [Candidatus Scalindua japonica]
MSKKICISVIGSGSGDDLLSPQISKIANEVGREIASRGAVLICGGLGGVMAEAAKGAKEIGGLTIGILPDEDPGSANPFIDIALPTGLGFARNVLVAYSGDAIIAVSGRLGTLTEISYALIKKKPVIGIQTWNLEQLSGRMSAFEELVYRDSVIRCENAKEAVDRAFAIIENKEN